MKPDGERERDRKGMAGVGEGEVMCQEQWKDNNWRGRV